MENSGFFDTSGAWHNPISANLLVFALLLLLLVVINQGVEHLDRYLTSVRQCCLLSIRDNLVSAVTRPESDPSRREREWLTADQRPALAERIISPIRSYTLARQLGRGDLGDICYAVADAGAWIAKVARHTGAGRLMLKEFRALRHLSGASRDDLYHKYFPYPEETFVSAGRRVNIFKWSGRYFSGEQIHKQYKHGLDGRHLAWMFKRMLEAIGFAHHHGWIHGAVLPPHLMFHADTHGLQVVGWIHAEELGQPVRVAPTRFKEWYPDECRWHKPSTPSVDIYLAAKSIIYLAGWGSPEQHHSRPCSHRSLPFFGRMPFEACRHASSRRLEITRGIQRTVGACVRISEVSSLENDEGCGRRTNVAGDTTKFVNTTDVTSETFVRRCFFTTFQVLN